MTISKIAALVAIGALASSAALAQIIPPAGRLTLTSNTPVMTSDVVGAGTIYYAPYAGNSMPISNGTSLSNSTFASQLTLTLNSTFHTAGNVYDIFVVNIGGLAICAGPAWSSSNSRGTGAGTTQLTQLQGIWVNAVTITTCYNGANNNQFVAKLGVYLGSFYATGNAQTSMSMSPGSAAGGTNNFLGLYNAFNRVTTISLASDSTASWTYATPTWQAADANNNNRITFLDGLQQSSVRASYVIETTVSNGVVGVIGVNLDSTSASPANPIGVTSLASAQAITAYGRFQPHLGLHYAQAMEYAGGATVTYSGNGVAFSGLMLEMEM